MWTIVYTSHNLWLLSSLNVYSLRDFQDLLFHYFHHHQSAHCSKTANDKGRLFPDNQKVAGKRVRLKKITSSVFLPLQTLFVACIPSNHHKGLCILLLLIRNKVKFKQYMHFDALKCDTTDRCSSSVEVLPQFTSFTLIQVSTTIAQKTCMNITRHVERYSTTCRNVCLM